MEAPSILVTGERRLSVEIERNTEKKVEKGSPEKVEEERQDTCEKGKVRSSHGEGLNVRKREGRRKSETPQLRKNENEEDGGEKAKEGQSRKREEKTKSGGKRGEERLATQKKDDEETRRSQKRESSPHHQSPSSSLLLGADLGVLRGRQGRRKSEVKVSQINVLVNIYDHIWAGSCIFVPDNPSTS